MPDTQYLTHSIRERWAQANQLVDRMRRGLKGTMSAGEIHEAIEEGRR